MNILSDRILSLEESQTIAMARQSRELIDCGVDIISLSLGEPDFDTPDFIKEAAKKAIDDNFSHYTPVPGLVELRRAISTKFKRDNKLAYAPDEIVASTGAKQTLAQLMLAIVNPGDEVIVPAPYWVSYFQMVKMAEGTPVVIEATVEADFKVTAQQVENAITSKTKAFLFSTPCNPTGSVYSRAELAELVKVFEKHPELIIISDEIYEHINFLGEHVSIGQFESIKDRVVTVNGVSKGFAMTGWRVGYLGAPKWLAAACTKMQGQTTSATCSIAQKATEAAVLADPICTKDMREAFLRRRDLMISKLQEIEGLKLSIPQGAFYIFPDVSHYFGKSFNGTKVKDANDFCMYLLNEANVATVTGEAFGSPNCMRISYAAADEILVEAVRRIKTALEKLA
ncbi:MAG: pyridoxal phosphate-dependent aminotransferase [Flavobacteriales bacterium]|jgi:aspartate aminotransferase|tara:strand:+ start:162 stop:1355 length:1194 start_codon:yes stop_codon:yes gene_type:complete